MVRVECNVTPSQSYVNGVLASAYQGTDGQTVVVLVNLSPEEQCCDLGLPKDVGVYTTSARTNLEKSRQDGSRIALPARAVVTCLYE
jgi:hypothetical protein